MQNLSGERGVSCTNIPKGSHLPFSLYGKFELLRGSTGFATSLPSWKILALSWHLGCSCSVYKW